MIFISGFSFFKFKWTENKTYFRWNSAQFTSWIPPCKWHHHQRPRAAAHGTHETCSMSVIHNVSYKCLTKQWISLQNKPLYSFWTRADWNIYNRWQTLHSSIDYIDYGDAGRAAMVPVHSILPSMCSPAVTWAADRPITAEAERSAADWPIRARGRRSLLWAGVRRCDRGSADGTFLNEQMWQRFDELVYSFTHSYGLKKWLWNKHAIYWL